MSGIAFGLYLVFIVSWFLHMPTRWPALGAVRFDAVLVGLITLGIVAGGVSSARTPGERSVRRWLTVLCLYALATIPLVEWPGSVVRFGLEKFAKAFVFYFFTAQLVTSDKRLRLFLLTVIACQSFRVFEPTYLHVTEGYWGSKASMANWESMDRLSGAPSDVINPNGLAFVILVIICFSHYLAPLTRVGSFAYVCALPVWLYALVLTGSRSGMLGLAAILALAWWKSQHKAALTLVLVAGLAFAVPRLSDNLRDRYESIVSSETKNTGTAEGRIRAWWTGLGVAMRRPLFGHGLGTSREAQFNFGESARIAHNLYVETAQELGFIGLAILLALIANIARNVLGTIRQLRARADKRPLLLRTADGLQVFLGMNVLFSLASYGLTSYEWYLLAGLSEVLARLAGAEPATQRVPRAFPEYGMSSQPLAPPQSAR